MLWYSPVGRIAPSLASDFIVAPADKVKNQPARLAMLGGGINFHMPIWFGKKSDLSFLANTHLVSLDTTAILPNSNVNLPKRFWDIKFGPAFRYKFKNNWVLGALTEVGSASDKPFASYDNLTVLANGFLRIPAKGRNAWMILLNYANNREYLPHVPLVFGGYFMNTKKMRAFWGIPLWMNIFPQRKLSFELFYAPIVVIKAEAKARLSESVSLLSGFSWDNFRYLRDARADKDDRLYYYIKRLYAGVEISPDKRAKAKLLVGYAFHRNIFESQSFLDKDYNRIDVGAGAFAKFELKLLFVPKKRMKYLSKGFE